MNAKTVSIKSQVIKVLMVSFFVSFCLVVTVLIVLHRYFLQEELSHISFKLAVSAPYQSDALIPGLLVQEQYGAIDLQLKELKATEELSNVFFLKSLDKDYQDQLGICSVLDTRNQICYNYKKKQAASITAIEGPNYRLGYLVKEKLLPQNITFPGITNSVLLLLIGFGTSFLVIVIWVSYFLYKSIQRPLQSLETDLNLSADPEHIQLGRFKVQEINAIATRIQTIVETYQGRRTQKKFTRIMTQLTQDLRLPVSALEMILKETSAFPKDIQVVVRNAVLRIRNITNNLLEKNKEFQEIPSTEGISRQPLSSIIEEIATEKRVAYKKNPEMSLQFNLNSSSYGLFSLIPLTKFKSVLSNLIDCIILSLSKTGVLSLTLNEGLERVTIEISYTGVSKLQKKVVRHFYEKIENMGGKFAIHSNAGFSTKINISFPSAHPPFWFVPKLEINRDSHIVILDDDPLIHHAWNYRFEPLINANGDGKVLHFTTTEALELWCNSESGLIIKAKALFLLDQEILGSKHTGLDLIEKLAISAQSVLVTGYYEEDFIIQRCLNLRTHLLPKNMIHLIPITQSACPNA